MSLIRDKVKRIVKKHNSICPFEISRSKGIIINYADLGDTYGFYFCDSRIKFININNNLNEEEQRLVCAHELGHAVLHPKANTPFMRKNTLFSIDKIEREANHFAAELLIPDSKITDTIEQLTIFDIASFHNVPKELVFLKFKGLF